MATLTGFLGSLGGPDSYFYKVADRLHPERALARQRAEQMKQEAELFPLQKQDMQSRLKARQMQLEDSRRQRALQKRQRESLSALAPQLAPRFGMPEEVLQNAIQSGVDLGEIAALGKLTQSPKPQYFKSGNDIIAIGQDGTAQVAFKGDNSNPMLESLLGMSAQKQRPQTLGSINRPSSPSDFEQVLGGQITAPGAQQTQQPQPQPQQQQLGQGLDPNALGIYGAVTGNNALVDYAQGLQKQKQEKKTKKKETNQAETALLGLSDDAMNMEHVIDQGINNTTGWTAGLGSTLGFIPGTPAADLDATLSTIEADAAFTRLQEMRDASKTGGALGQVSERELDLLANARAALRQSQSPEQLKSNLRRYKTLRNRSFKRVGQAFKKDYGYVPKGFDQYMQEPNSSRINFNQGWSIRKK